MKEFKVFKNMEKNPKFLGMETSNAFLILVMLALVILWLIVLPIVMAITLSIVTSSILLGYMILKSSYNFSYLQTLKNKIKELNFFDEQFKRNLK